MIFKLSNGRAHDPRRLVAQTLADIAERVGGLEEFQRILQRCDDAIPRKALDIALRRARRENILTSVGESLLGLSVLTSFLWMLEPASYTDISRPPGELLWLSLKLFLPTAAALVIHVWLQMTWHLSWYRSALLPALERHSEAAAVSATLMFYRDIARRMAIPGVVLYVATTVITLALLDPRAMIWAIILPVSVLIGWVVNCVQYYTRLLHADPCEWFGAFAIDLSPDAEEAIHEARKGSGLCRFVCDQLEAYGYAKVIPFDAYVLTQGICGLVSTVVILTAMVSLSDLSLRLLIAVPAGVGVHILAISFFLRFEFLHRRLTPRAAESNDASSNDVESLTENGVEARSQEFRRTMP